MPTLPRLFLFALVLACLAAIPAHAQNSPAPNSDPVYQQLRNLTLGQEAVSVTAFDLKRDAATFHLKSGTVCFVTPVDGKVTGAVFVGDGSMTLNPPIAEERRSLKLFTKSDEFSETFQHLVLRFTDSTYDELKKAGAPSQNSCDPGLLKDSQNAMRHYPTLKRNIDGRLLEDLLNSQSGYFLAFVHGKNYNNKELFIIDPHGAPDVYPEEVEFATYDENLSGIWAAFHLAREYANGTASGSQQNALIHIDHQQLDSTIEKSANLIGKATTTFVSHVDGLRVVPFDLFRSLRVHSVTENGQALSFIQEDKNDDASFFVILPKALASGESCTIVTSYEGKEAVVNTGNGNYFPVARKDWYPDNNDGGLSEYTNYDMTFRIPKNMKIAATGSPVKESVEGGERVSVWKSEVPQTVAGFNFGLFKMEQATLKQPEYTVASYANEEPPDWVEALLHNINGDLPDVRNGVSLGGNEPDVAMGTMNTTTMLKKALGDGEMSVELYSDYFGPLPFKRLAITQQTACTFGQSWPTLVWLPICSFFDATVRHNLGLDFGDRGYWKSVTPHEVAHQWWGHEVGFGSYRDQWMSEGFADMSASLFIQAVEKNPKKFKEFWNDERQMIVERNRYGFRTIDVGPLTMGFRLDNTRTGVNIYRELIYPKGAYILHMIRMMMWSNQTGDKDFKDMMHDFVKTYGGRAATTEDFKAILERHMNRDMNTAGNGKMDWFFNEYVYGIALPSYIFNATFDKDAAGDLIFHYNLVQSGVDDNFIMPVPVYFELANGRTVELGRIRIKGNSTEEGKVALKGMKDPPKRALINYNNDVLAAN